MMDDDVADESGESYDGNEYPSSSVPEDEYNIDDLEPGDWEEHMGGPDDVESEELPDNEDESEVDELEFDESDEEGELTESYWEALIEEHEIDKLDSDEPDEEGELTESYWEALMKEHEIDEPKLLSWLLNSGVSVLIDGGDEGFFIRPGTLVKTGNGDIKEAIDWLVGDLGLGVADRHLMASYRVVYLNSASCSQRRLWFLKCDAVSRVIDVPNSGTDNGRDVEIVEGEDVFISRDEHFSIVEVDDDIPF